MYLLLKQQTSNAYLIPARVRFVFLPLVAWVVVPSCNAQAGGFALEDPDLRLLVERVEGSVDSVLGLPVDLLCDLMKRAAHRVGA